MTTAMMTAPRAGWGKAMWFPIGAIVVRLGGGFITGRVLKQPPAPHAARYQFDNAHEDDEDAQDTEGAEAPNAPPSKEKHVAAAAHQGEAEEAPPAAPSAHEK